MSLFYSAAGIIQQVVGSLLLFVIFLFSGCYSDKQCVCPEYYAPVCGKNGKTYANPCLAECDDMDYMDGECPVYGIGVVKFTGDTVPGCDVMVSLSDDLFKPRVLPNEYKVHNKVVSLRYRKLNEYFTCDNPYAHYRVIDILEIGSY